MDILNTSQNIFSTRVGGLQSSRIREVAEAGMGNPDLIALWFGEGCWQTSPVAVEAAVEALRNGQHFYQSNNGMPPLRHAIRDYTKQIFDIDLALEQITVTSSGMQGMALCAQALVDPGDRVISIEPAWPNLAEAFRISGADIEFQNLRPKDGVWALDLDELLTRLTPGTRAVIINSPNNPTGWTLDEEGLKTILNHCRKHGIWIIGDDVYSRLFRGGNHAPCFLSVAEPEDRVISVNSFSKAWSMTGWRLGWITAPVELETALATLTEFNIACAPPFVQATGVVMLRDGEQEIALLRERLAAAYAVTSKRLAAMERVTFIEPEGAFYSFFAVDGLTDSLEFAKKLARETRVGLAPGIAFGAQGEGYLRLCYAQPVDRLEQAFDRLDKKLG